MTTIRTTCVRCGNIELTVDQVTLEPGHYRFNCPECGGIRTLPASPKVIGILLAVGAEYGPGPITEEEIEDFVIELNLRDKRKT